MFLRVLVVLLTLAELQASAATKVTQQLTISTDKNDFTEEHRWLISEKKFRLNVQGKKRKVSYIFNGRTFVACLQADADEIKNSSLIKGDDSLLQQVTKGICINTPINVISSFFLSPHNFVSALDMTDSLQLRLQLRNYLATPPKKQTKKDCKEISRKFSYQYFAYMNEKNLQNKANETVCYDPSLNWRSSMWRQLSRTLLRQKDGRTLRELIQKDKIFTEGFAVEKTASYEIKDGRKTIRNITMTLKTESMKKVKTSSKDFKTPAGYDFYGTETAWEVASGTKSSHPGDKKRPSDDADETIRNNKFNILLYFLSSPF